MTALVDQLKGGLDAPICLTWELTYACNLECVHCLSSSGRRDPRELTTAEAKAVLDELHELQVFYINIGGGEPMIRRDFFELVEYSISKGIGVKFSTNGAFIDADKARRLAAMDYLDIQISLDGTDRRHQRRRPRRGLVRHRDPGDGSPPRRRIRAVQDLGRRHPPQRRSARRLQGARRFVRSPAARHAVCARRVEAPTPGTICTPPIASNARSTSGCWPTASEVLTGDSFFHLNALGDENLPGLNLCGAGRVVCLIDPIGDVYACPFVIHDEFKAGNVRDAGGFSRIWKHSELFVELRRPAVGRGVCVVRLVRRVPGRLHGRQVLHRPTARRPRSRMRRRRGRGGARRGIGTERAEAMMDHSKPARSTPVALIRK